MDFSFSEMESLGLFYTFQYQRKLIGNLKKNSQKPAVWYYFIFDPFETN